MPQIPIHPKEAASLVSLRLSESSPSHPNQGIHGQPGDDDGQILIPSGSVWVDIPIQVAAPSFLSPIALF